MNLIIIDEENKEYHNFIGLIKTQKDKIINQIIKINDKFELYLRVEEDVDTDSLDDDNFIENKNLLDKLRIGYNNSLNKGEEII